MEKEKTMQKNNLIFIFTVCLLVISCKDERKINLEPQRIDYMYSVTYKKDSILVEKQEQGADISPLILYSLGGEYFDKRNDKLFLSTKRDTTFEVENMRFYYEIEIKKGMQKGIYETNIFLINQETKHYLMTYYYDVKYNIIKIDESKTVTFR